MEWTVLIGDEFEPEFFVLPKDVQDEVLAMTRLLQHSGPHLGRPHVDTLKDSKHAKGRIALQYGGGIVRFRKVEIRPL